MRLTVTRLMQGTIAKTAIFTGGGIIEDVGFETSEK
jgi:hypothetical protein